MTFDIGTVSAASAVSPADQINAVIASTQQALNALGAAADGANWHSSILRQQVPVGSDVAVGHLVYWKAGDGCYEPAVAELTGASGNGASVESVRSHVEGIIIEVSHDGGTHTGTLLTGGYYESTEAMGNCLIGTQTAGTYYLNPDSLHPGTAVPVDRTYGKLQQGILSYYGAGKFSLNLFYQANDHHYHGSTWLSGGTWEAADSGHVGPVAWGANAHWYKWYHTDATTGETVVDDERFATALPIANDITSVFYNGAFVKLGNGASDTFFISDGSTLWFNGTAPAHDTCMVNHFPFAYGSPVVRDVVADGGLISVSNSNGLVTVSHNGYSAGATAANAYAVSSIASGTVSYTPVVSVLKAASGIQATYGSDGSVTIAAANSIGTPADAYGMTHNGTVIKSSGLMQYITFPAGRQASIVISMPVTGIGAATQLAAVCWGELAGSTGGDFSVQSLFIPLPDGSTTYSTAVTSGTMHFSGGYGGTGTAYCEYAQATSSLTFAGNGMLVASVTISNPPVADVTLLRLGFKCSVLAAGGGSGQEASSYSSITVTQKATTDATAPQPAVRRCVKMLTSGIAMCTSVAADANTCIGIASEISGAGIPADVTYVTAGVLDGFSFGTSAVGTALYIGADGAPTANAPTSGYRQQVGTVLSATSMLVTLQTAVLLQ